MNISINNLFLLFTLLIMFSCSNTGNTSAEIEVSNDTVIDSVIFRVKTFPLNKAYAKTSINTSVFRANSIVSDSIFQFVSYYDDAGYIEFAKRNLKTEKWEYYKTDFCQDCSDAHKSISIALDGDGYLHMCYGMHGSIMNYYQSKHPYTFDFYRQSYMVDSVDEQSLTYPQFYKKRNGNLIFSCRKTAAPNLLLYEYDLATKQWKNLNHEGILDKGNSWFVYWQMCLDYNDGIHISGLWREVGDPVTNHDLFYAYSKDGKNWCNSKNEFYSLPITKENAELARVIPQGSDYINQTSMAVDINNKPYICTYWRDLGSDIPQYRVVWNDSLTWKMCEVGQRTTPFTIADTKGTLRIPISRPLIFIDKKGRTFMLFRDIDRGEVATLAYCSDINSPLWKYIDLTSSSLEAWEPTIDIDRFKRDGILDIFIQKAYQGEGEKALGNIDAEKAYILELEIQ